MKKISVIVFISYLVLTVLLIKDDLQSDGYLEVGFPFTFYKTTHGKFDGTVKLGFFIDKFIFDLFLVFLFVIIVYLIIRSIKRR